MYYVLQDTVTSSLPSFNRIVFKSCFTSGSGFLPWNNATFGFGAVFFVVFVFVFVCAVLAVVFAADVAFVPAVWLRDELNDFERFMTARPLLPCRLSIISRLLLGKDFANTDCGSIRLSTGCASVSNYIFDPLLHINTLGPRWVEQASRTRLKYRVCMDMCHIW